MPRTILKEREINSLFYDKAISFFVILMQFLKFKYFYMSKKTPLDKVRNIGIIAHIDA
jgi:hypothetical protein